MCLFYDLVVVLFLYRCSERLSRVSAYDLIVELCTGCYENLVLVVRQLVSMHHQENPQLAKEWEVHLVQLITKLPLSSSVKPVVVHSIVLYISAHSIAPTPCDWSKFMWFCWSKECWGYLLHELCTPATVHDRTNQRYYTWSRH